MLDVVRFPTRPLECHYFEPAPSTQKCFPDSSLFSNQSASSLSLCERVSAFFQRIIAVIKGWFTNSESVESSVPEQVQQSSLRPVQPTSSVPDDLITPVEPTSSVSHHLRATRSHQIVSNHVSGTMRPQSLPTSAQPISQTDAAATHAAFEARRAEILARSDGQLRTLQSMRDQTNQRVEAFRAAGLNTIRDNQQALQTRLGQLEVESQTAHAQQRRIQEHFAFRLIAASGDRDALAQVEQDLAACMQDPVAYLARVTP